MKKVSSLLIALFGLANIVIAQQPQNNIWYFGYNAGIDFNSGSPVAITNSAMQTGEAAATMSSCTGELLFYTNGFTVWNKLHEVMDNGDNLSGCPSTTQTMIVPKPISSSESIYYIFTADCIENLLATGLRYDVVDMTQNGGLGKLIQKNILLHELMTEKITTVTHANGKDFWVITHEWNSNQFFVYLVTAAGLNSTPIVSAVGATYTDINASSQKATGYIKSSFDGQKLVCASATILEIFDFDNSTGIISNTLPLPADTSFGGSEYGVTFSPDNSKLYTCYGVISNGKLNQYNLNAGTIQDIVNSKTELFFKSCNNFPPDTCVSFGAMQLGIDGKIYVAHTSLNNNLRDSTLGVINNPNSLGLSCNYVHDGFWLGGKSNYISLPNFIQTPFLYGNCHVGIAKNQQRSHDLINLKKSLVMDELVFEIFPKENEEITLSIINSMGQTILIKKITIASQDIISFPISNLNSGIYCLLVDFKEKVCAQKFIVIN